MNMKNKDEIVIYQTDDGKIELRADIKGDTIWATQAQIATLFEVDTRTINEHLKNVFRTKELKETSTLRKFRIVQNEGGRNVNRVTNFYNLDAIIAVGYRVSSMKATQFRIWATGILFEYLKNGYALQKYKLSNSSESIKGLQEAIALITSNKNPGKLKGKLTLKITKNMNENEE